MTTLTGDSDSMFPAETITNTKPKLTSYKQQNTLIMVTANVECF